MSIFNDLLPKIIEIPKNYINKSNDELEAALKILQKMEDDYFRSKTRAPEKSLMTTLQSIDEDDDETRISPKGHPTSSLESSASEPPPQTKRASMKRGKDQVDGLCSPAIDKKQKRNASVKAQSIISAQVNVNLSQKLRRESPDARKRKDQARKLPVPLINIKQEKVSLPPADPLPPPNIKQERLTAATGDDKMPPPMALPKRGRPAQQRSSQAESGDESTRRSTRTRKPKDMDFPLPASTRSSRASSRSKVAEEINVVETSDAECMPPPEARPKRTRAKKKLSESSNPDAEKENTPGNVVASPNDKPRPKRTRRGQKAAEKEAELKKPSPVKPKEVSISPKEERISEPQPKLKSPVLRIERMSDRQKEKTQKQNSVEEKQKLQKQNSREKVDKNLQKQNSVEEVTDLNKQRLQKQSSKELDKKTQKQQSDVEKKVQKESNDKKRLEKQISEPSTHSTKMKDMVELSKKLQKQNSDFEKQNMKLQKSNSDLEKQSSKLPKPNPKDEKQTYKLNKNNQEAKIVKEDIRLNETVVIEPLDSTMVLTNGVYNHAPVTPQNIRAANATVTVDRDTIVLANVNDATVVLSAEIQSNMTADASILTDDASPAKESTPEKISPPEPTSAVKQKVQQFEQMAARTTRTKTRQQQKESQEADHTPPNVAPGPSACITADTLSKMNNMIFNGKAPSTSNSAVKPRAIVQPKSRAASASASKATALSRQYEESVAQESARKKKEAILEAKREQQRKKREEKIAAAAAAREAAERERRLAMEAAARERQEKQAHADQGKLERLKEVERKKLELARKVAETEERRRAEEQARQQRLLEESKRAEAAKRKQAEEAEAMRKEEMTAKEIEKRQKEYIEKQKMRQRLDLAKPATPGRTPPRPVPPTYMADGFQYLDSDEDHSPKPRPLPDWAYSKTKKVLLAIQAELPPSIPLRLFTMKVHSPDLREIFPGISRNRLVRTSSAVWRTPPRIDPVLISRLEQAEGVV